MIQNARVLLAILVAPLALFGWQLLYPLSCLALLIPFVSWAVLALYARDIQKKHRECIAGFYFSDGSLLQGLAKASVRVWVLSAASASLFTFAFFASAPLWGVEVTMLFALDAVAVTLIYAGLTRLVHRDAGVQAHAANVIARQWTTALNTALLLALIVAISFHLPPPEGIDLNASFADNVRQTGTDQMSACAVVDMVVRVGAQIDVLRWLAVLNISGLLQNAEMRWLVWTLFLLNGALAAIAYSRLCVQCAHYALGSPNRESPE